MKETDVTGKDSEIKRLKLMLGITELSKRIS